MGLNLPNPSTTLDSKVINELLNGKMNDVKLFPIYNEDTNFIIDFNNKYTILWDAPHNCDNIKNETRILKSLNKLNISIFENNGTSRLVLRSTHRDIIDTCYFSGSGMRVYGTKHNIKHIQLVDNANILLSKIAFGNNNSGLRFFRY